MATLEQGREIFMQYYDMYYNQLVQYISTASTSAYVFTVLATCALPILALSLHEQEETKRLASRPKGCRKLGLVNESNLENEFDPKFSAVHSPNVQGNAEESWRVKSIWIYPVKSCRGVELDQGTVIESGMQYDRQFSFAQLKNPPPAAMNNAEKDAPAQKWEFITQRQFRLLATVKAEMWVPDTKSGTYAPHAEEVKSGGVIIISFPYQEPGWRGTIAKLAATIRGTTPEKRFRVPFDPSPEQIEKAGYTFEKMTIWKDSPSALNLSSEIPPELSTYLGLSNKLGLFRTDSSQLREVYRCAPTKEELGYQPVTGFQDAVSPPFYIMFHFPCSPPFETPNLTPPQYPLHILSLSSVHALSALMPAGKTPLPKLSAQRFRANIILSGTPAFAEDTWRRIMIGEHEYDVSCRTARCKLPNVDQETGERHASEPDRTLRSERAVDAGAKGTGCLGMQVVPIGRRGSVRVGERVRVLKYGEHEYIKQ